MGLTRACIHIWLTGRIQVTQTLPDGSTVVLANATMFSYPLKFYGGSLECAPVELD